MSGKTGRYESDPRSVHGGAGQARRREVPARCAPNTSVEEDRRATCEPATARRCRRAETGSWGRPARRRLFSPRLQQLLTSAARRWGRLVRSALDYPLSYRS